MIGAILEETLRRERVQLSAQLYRIARDLDLVDDALQHACGAALVAWRETMPSNPAGWLLVAARNYLVDHRRKSKNNELFLQTPPAEPTTGKLEQEREDYLRLLFAVARTDIPEKARIALCLRTFLGLSTSEIARGLMTTDMALEQLIARAKRRLRATPLQDEEFDDPARISMVLRTIYLAFNEGYSATGGTELVRPTLISNALDLGEMLVLMFPDHSEAAGLAALMYLQSARSAARINDYGAFVVLSEQNPNRFDERRIERGTALLVASANRASVAGSAPGSYLIQASIAAVHASAKDGPTDWAQVVALYTKLLDVERNDVIELSAAVAVAFYGETRRALAWVNALERKGTLRSYRWFYFVKAGLLVRAGFPKQARRYFAKLQRFPLSPSERLFVENQLRSVSSSLALQ